MLKGLSKLVFELKKTAGEDSGQPDQQTQDQTDQSGQDQQGQDQSGQQDGQPDQNSQLKEIVDVITNLADQMDGLKYEINKVKTSIVDQSKFEDPDLNTTVLASSDFMRKTAFLQIMDELNDVADAILPMNPKLSNRIDNIMDSLRIYNKTI